MTAANPRGMAPLDAFLPAIGLVIGLTLLYRYAMSHRAPVAWLPATAGGLVATLMSVVSSWLCAIYVEQIAPLGATYGSVGAVVVLLIWLFVGGNTADDGYQVTVGRIAGEAGYLDNYYRYFGVPQDPFGWHYHYLSAWMEISTATPWLRVLPFMFAMASWWLISRAAIPRRSPTPSPLTSENERG
mgnify:CR=1 FL=1